jgi:hypothetical protein
MNAEPEVLAELFRDMLALIEARKPGMSAAEVDRALGWLASVSMICDQATQHCNQFHLSDPEARQYMYGLLKGVVESSRLAVNETGVTH